MNMERSIRFQTSDYWLAAALLTAGRTIHSLTWSGSRATFAFNNLERCSALEHAYWSGDLHVSAKSFSDALRTLKDRLRGDSRQRLNP